MGREIGHMGSILEMARDYARAQGFKGTFSFNRSPSPNEPFKHQYEILTRQNAMDSFVTIWLGEGFQNKYRVNHATLAQHTFQSRLAVCR